MKQTKLKAFLISYAYAENVYLFLQGRSEVKNVVIIERFEEKAVKKLMKHLTLNMKYKEEGINIISIQRLRKTNKNAYFFTQEFYNKQEIIIQYAFEKYLKERNKQ